MPTGFDARAYLPREVYEGITEIRVRQPGFADGEADRRARRRVTAPDGKLVILAVDDPGRASLGGPDDPMAMGDRHEYLARILRVLSHAEVDGVMSTPDVVEDLLILAGLIRERGGQSPLDERLLIGSMNRGGPRGLSRRWTIASPPLRPVGWRCSAWTAGSSRCGSTARIAALWRRSPTSPTSKVAPGR